MLRYWPKLFSMTYFMVWLWYYRWQQWVWEKFPFLKVTSIKKKLHFQGAHLRMRAYTHTRTVRVRSRAENKHGTINQLNLMTTIAAAPPSPLPAVPASWFSGEDKHFSMLSCQPATVQLNDCWHERHKIHTVTTSCRDLRKNCWLLLKTSYGYKKTFSPTGRNTKTSGCKTDDRTPLTWNTVCNKSFYCRFSGRVIWQNA